MKDKETRDGPRLAGPLVVPLDPFSGEDPGLYLADWIYEYERRMEEYNVEADSDRRRMAIENALTGPAKKTWMQIRESHRGQPIATLLKKLQDDFDIDCRIRLVDQLLNLQMKDSIQTFKDELLRLAGRLRREDPEWNFSDHNLVDIFRLRLGTDRWRAVVAQAAGSPLNTVDAVWRVIVENHLDEGSTISAVLSRSSLSAVPVQPVQAVGQSQAPQPQSGSRRRRKTRQNDNHESKDELPRYCYDWMTPGRGCQRANCAFSHDTSKVVCTVCKGLGHLPPVCPLRWQNEQNKLVASATPASVSGVTFASLAQQTLSAGDRPFIGGFGPADRLVAKIDSGAAVDLFPKSAMASAREVPPTQFVTAGGAPMESRVVGKVVMQAQGRSLEIPHAHHVEGLVSPLVSVGNLTN
jgi:hypothetical protein